MPLSPHHGTKPQISPYAVSIITGPNSELISRMGPRHGAVPIPVAGGVGMWGYDLLEKKPLEFPPPQAAPNAVRIYHTLEPTVSYTDTPPGTPHSAPFQCPHLCSHCSGRGSDAFIAGGQRGDPARHQGQRPVAGQSPQISSHSMCDLVPTAAPSSAWVTSSRSDIWLSSRGRMERNVQVPPRLFSHCKNHSELFIRLPRANVPSWGSRYCLHVRCGIKCSKIASYPPQRSRCVDKGLL